VGLLVLGESLPLSLLLSVSPDEVDCRASKEEEVSDARSFETEDETGRRTHT